LIKGWKFSVKDLDMYLKLQNSKFLVRSDKNIRNIDYFSVLTNIIKLSYSYRNNIVLFKCD